MLVLIIYLEECFKAVVLIGPMLNWWWGKNLGAYCSNLGISDYTCVGLLRKTEVSKAYGHLGINIEIMQTIKLFKLCLYSQPL